MLIERENNSLKQAQDLTLHGPSRATISSVTIWKNYSPSFIFDTTRMRHLGDSPENADCSPDSDGPRCH